MKLRILSAVVALSSLTFGQLFVVDPYGVAGTHTSLRAAVNAASPILPTTIQIIGRRTSGTTAFVHTNALENWTGQGPITLTSNLTIVWNEAASDQILGSPVRPVMMVTGVETCFAMDCLLYTSPSPRDRQKSRMPSSA